MTNLEHLLLHPKTRLQLEYVLKNPPQAVLLTADAGSGKKTLAKTLSASMLEIKDSMDIENQPYFIHVSRLKNKSDISIEQIRDVVKALKLKTPGDAKIRKVVFIEDSHYLSIPAQNALLKILEEPSSDTVFLLSANSVQNVLPTVASRTQKIDVLPATLNDSLKHWSDEHEARLVESAWRLSGGSVGLMHALLTEDTEHRLKKAVDEAKSFLRSNAYQRLLLCDQLAKSKENFQTFLDALSRTVNVLHHQALKNGRTKQSVNLLESRKTINLISNALQANANAKLLALKLALGLKV